MGIPKDKKLLRTGVQVEMRKWGTWSKTHVKWRLETSAVFQEVCLSVRFSEMTLRRHPLYTKRSSSHSYKYYLFFFVSGRMLEETSSMRMIEVKTSNSLLGIVIDVLWMEGYFVELLFNIFHMKRNLMKLNAIFLPRVCHQWGDGARGKAIVGEWLPAEEHVHWRGEIEEEEDKLVNNQYKIDSSILL